MSLTPTTDRKPRDDEIDAYGLTHLGHVRKENQDHFLLGPSTIYLERTNPENKSSATAVTPARAHPQPSQRPSFMDALSAQSKVLAVPTAFPYGESREDTAVDRESFARSSGFP